MDEERGADHQIFPFPKWHHRWPGLFILACVAAVSLTSYGGRSPIQKPLRADTRTLMNGPGGGTLSMAWESRLDLHILPEWPDRKLSVRFDLMPRWIGQVFFLATSKDGETRTFITGQDIDRTRDVRQTLELKVSAGEMSIGFFDGDKFRATPLPPGRLEKISLLSKQSHFRIDNLLVLRAGTDEILYQNDFGHGVTETKRLFFLSLRLFFALLLIRWGEDRLLTRLGLATRGAAFGTFVAACFPGALALGLIDLSARTTALLPLIAATVVWRVSLLPKRSWDLPRQAAWALLIIPAAWAMARVFHPLQIEDAAGPNLEFVIPFAAGLLVFLVLETAIWKWGGQWKWPAAIHASCAPLIFAALALGDPFRPMDPRDAAAACAVALPAVFAAKLSFLRSYGKKLPGTQWMMLLLALLILVGVEGSLRHAGFTQKWAPERLAEEDMRKDALFWAPKTLFVPKADFGGRGDYLVEEIRYRSGTIPNRVPAGVFRIVIMGGSNVWGDRLEKLSDTWGAKLEAKLNRLEGGPRYQVVNAGVKGYNLFQLNVLHSLYMKDLEYDLLILYCNFNDAVAYDEYGPFSLRELWEAKTGGDWSRIEDYLVRQGLREGRSWVIGTQDTLRSLRLYQGLTAAITSWRGRRIAGSDKTMGMKRINPLEDYVANLEKMVSLAKKRGARTMFATEFVWTLKGLQPSAKESRVLFNTAMRETAEKTGVDFCDTHAGLSASRENLMELVFPWDTVHLNPTGTGVLASHLLSCLEEKRLLPD